MERDGCVCEKKAMLHCWLGIYDRASVRGWGRMGFVDISDAIPCNEGMLARCGLDILEGFVCFRLDIVGRAEAVSYLFQGLGWVRRLGRADVLFDVVGGWWGWVAVGF